MIDLTDDGLMANGFYIAVRLADGEMVYIGPIATPPPLMDSEYQIPELNMVGKVRRYITIFSRFYQESGMVDI